MLQFNTNFIGTLKLYGMIDIMGNFSSTKIGYICFGSFHYIWLEKIQMNWRVWHASVRNIA